MTKCESLLCLLMLSQFSIMICANLNRKKRTLVWPQGGSKLLAIYGIGVPVDLPSATVIVGTVIKANYRFPTNASQITDPFVTSARNKRALNRWDFYALVVQALEMKGFDGRSCLLRAICEIAQTPVVKNFGLFHELIHTFFTPTSTKEKNNQHSDNEYYAAQILGKTNESCEAIFRDCSSGLLDVFTIFN